MAEPALSEVHADLVNRLKQDERLRAVETQQAATNAEVGNLRGDIHRLETTAAAGFTELKTVIQNSKPKIWPAVSGIVATLAVVLIIAERLYS